MNNKEQNKTKELTMTYLRNKGTIKNKLNEIIDLHEKMKNCYFWSPKGNRYDRLRYEKQNSNHVYFYH